MIRELRGEIRRHFVSDAGVQRPGEIPFGSIVGEIVAADWRRVVLEVAADDDVVETDAGTDQRRYAPPGAEIGVDIGEHDPFRLAAEVSLGQRADTIEPLEVRLAPELPGDVRAQPGIELIADAEVEDATAVDAVRQVLLRGYRSVDRDCAKLPLS